MNKKYLCAFCNLVKEEKRYVYASSTKNVKVVVCRSCHEAKMREMKDFAATFMGERVVLGVLRSHPKPIEQE